MPGVNKEWGAEIRGCLTRPDENHLLFGADISGLESATAQHYMYYYDPDYVNDMRVEGYDPHTDIALIAKRMTEDEVEFFRWYSEKL